MEQCNGEGRSRHLWGEQDRENQCSSYSNSQTEFNEPSETDGSQLGRAFRADSPRAIPVISGQSTEAIDGGIIRQLIENLQNQRALYQQQIQAIDEQVTGLEELLETVETETSDDE